MLVNKTVNSSREGIKFVTIDFCSDIGLVESGLWDKQYFRYLKTKQRNIFSSLSWFLVFRNQSKAITINGDLTTG